MNTLTRQWFNEVNQDHIGSREESKSKVTFKKSNGVSTTINDNKTYHKLDPKNAASILLDSTDDEDDDDDVIIDKTKLIN